MIQLLYSVIFGQMVLILLLLFETPFRKLLINAFDRVKQGRGPVVVSTVGATLLIVLASSLYSMVNIQRRILEGGIVNPTDEVLMSKHMLEASLMGFVLFLLLMMDRLTMEAVEKQNRSDEDGKNSSAEERKAMLADIGTLQKKIKNLESECEVERSKAKKLEAEVQALKKQTEGDWADNLIRKAFVESFTHSNS